MAAAAAYRFGVFELFPSRRRLLADGVETLLGRPVFDLLVALIERRDRLVTKQELLDLVWPDLAIEENNLTVAIAALRRALHDDAQRQGVIRTVSGRGYQFVAPVEVPMPRVEIAAESMMPPAAGEHAAAPPLPAKASIAVLPFANLSGDTDQEYFADGIVEDITTNLARNRWLFVIARNSAFSYRGQAVSLQQVARELGVRYVLEGSVRRACTRVRVTAQLIDALTGMHLCAERYDGDLSDIFAVQDDIARRVAEIIEPALREAEGQRAARAPPETLDAWLAYHRGMWHVAKSSAEENALAQRCFERAIALDASFAPGYYGLARCLIYAGNDYGTQPIEASTERAWQLACQAVALDRLDPSAHAALAVCLLVRGDHQAALDAVEQLLSLNPNDAWAYGIRGAALVFSGRSDEGLVALAQCIRHSPRDPVLMVRVYHMAVAHFFAGRLTEAVGIAQRVTRQWPNFPHAHRILAVALAESGRIDEAREALRAGIALSPATFEAFMQNRVPMLRAEDHARLMAAFRKAGASEQRTAGTGCPDAKTRTAGIKSTEPAGV